MSTLVQYDQYAELSNSCAMVIHMIEQILFVDSLKRRSALLVSKESLNSELIFQVKGLKFS